MYAQVNKGGSGRNKIQLLIEAGETMDDFSHFSFKRFCKVKKKKITIKYFSKAINCSLTTYFYFYIHIPS